MLKEKKFLEGVLEKAATLEASIGDLDTALEFASEGEEFAQDKGPNPETTGCCENNRSSKDLTNQ